MKSNLFKIVGNLIFISMAAFIFNYVWEMVQMPLFENMMYTEWKSWVTCFFASIGDVLIILVFYFFGILIFKSWSWPEKLQLAKIAFLMTAGFLTAVYFEWDALQTGRWQYSDLMPLIPVIRVGIIPVIQLMILPVLSYKVSLKILKYIYKEYIIKQHNKGKKIMLIVTLMLVISVLHFLTLQRLVHFHAFYRILTFVPMILGSFWFGLTGALFILGGYLIFYFPYILTHWQGFSVFDFEKILSVLLFAAIAMLLGWMSDRERRQQKQLREIKALAYLGESISMAAHELKTPIISIGGFTRLVRKHISTSDPIGEKLDIVLKETDRLEKLVNEMLDYSRKIEVNKKPCDLTDFLRQCLHFVQHETNQHKIELNFNTNNHLPLIPLDEQKMKQVMINILNNAIEASPIGESIIIAADCRGPLLLIDVIDSGEGISDDHLKSVFQPFFTTRKKGTGLGLPIAKKIVNAHGGQINILKNREKGVTVRIKLSRT